MSKNFRYVQERDDLSKTMFHKRPRLIRCRGTWILQVFFEIWSNMEPRTEEEKSSVINNTQVKR